MPKVKCCAVTTVHQPFDIRIFYKQCRSLAEHGFEVVLIAPHHRDELVDGVQIRGLGTMQGRGRRATFLAARAFRWAVAEHADIYHVHDPELIPLARMLQLLGKVVVYDMHEDLPKSILSRPWIAGWLRNQAAKVAATCERTMLAGLPVVGAAECIDYVTQGRAAVTVENYPILEELFSIRSAKHAQPSLAYIGGIEPDRGSLVMLDVTQELQRRGLDVRLDCVGRVSDIHRQELSDYARSRGLRDVHLHGLVPAHEAWKIASRAHVGLSLLKAKPNYLEALPTKVLEYMALAMPVVASNSPRLNRLFTEHGCGVPVDPAAPAKIADAIEGLLYNPQSAREMGERGRDAVQRQYQWTTQFRKLLSLYERLTNNKGSSAARRNALSRSERRQWEASRA